MKKVLMLSMVALLVISGALAQYEVGTPIAIDLNDSKPLAVTYNQTNVSFEIVNNSAIFTPTKAGVYLLEFENESRQISVESFKIIEESEIGLGNTTTIRIPENATSLEIFVESDVYQVPIQNKKSIEFKAPRAGIYTIHIKTQIAIHVATLKVGIHDPIVMEKERYKLGQRVDVQINLDNYSAYQLIVRSVTNYFHFLGELEDYLSYIPQEVGEHVIEIRKEGVIIYQKKFAVFEKEQEESVVYTDKTEYLIGEQVQITIKGSARSLHIFDGVDEFITKDATSTTFTPTRVGHHKLTVEFSDTNKSLSFLVRQEQEQNYEFEDEDVSIAFSLREEVESRRSVLNQLLGTNPLKEITVFVDGFENDERFVIDLSKESEYDFVATLYHHDQIKAANYTLIIKALIGSDEIEKRVPFSWLLTEPEKEEARILEYNFDQSETVEINVDFGDYIQRSPIELTQESTFVESIAAYIHSHHENDQLQLSLGHVIKDEFDVTIDHPSMPADVYTLVVLARARDQWFARQVLFNWGLENETAIQTRVNETNQTIDLEEIIKIANLEIKNQTNQSEQVIIDVNLQSDKPVYDLGEEVRLSANYNIETLFISVAGSTYEIEARSPEFVFNATQLGSYFVKASFVGSDLETNTSFEVINKTKQKAKKISKINITLKDPSQKEFKANTLIKYPNGSIAKQINQGLLARIQSAVSEEVILEEGNYTIEITPTESPIEHILLNDVSFDGTVNLGVDDLEEENQKINNREVVEYFAVNPEEINFSTGLLTLEAKGRELYKCKDWDFAARSCFGTWEKIKTLTPGEKYTIEISPDDPGFAEAGISIITVQSFPVVGGFWDVKFNTTGTANLTIRAVKTTTWTNIDEQGHDLKFIELRCGDQVQSYEWINDSVHIEDYSCNEISRERSKVATSGKHDLEFRFGDDVGYAKNLADQDFLIQRVLVTDFGLTEDSVDVAIPIELGRTDRAYARITNTGKMSGGPPADAGDQEPDDMGVTIELLSTTQFRLSRESSGANADQRVQVEIIEYIGPENGPNEFVVISNGTIAQAGAGTTSVNITGVSNINDTVAIMTGIRSTTTSNQGDDITAILYMAAEDNLTLERDSSGGTTTVSYSLIEFTGSNWQIGHTGRFQFTATSTQDAPLYRDAINQEDVMDIGSWTNAFIEFSFQAEDGNNGLREIAMLAWNGTNSTVVSVDLRDDADNVGAGTDYYTVAYAISNPNLSVQWVQAPEGAPDNDFNVSFVPATSMNTTSTFGTMITSGNGQAFTRNARNFQLENIANIGFWGHRTGNTVEITAAMIEWPTAPRLLPNVSNLTNPLNGSTITALPINFTFNVSDLDDNIANCTLFANFSGAFGPNVTTESILNNQINNITVEPPEGDYFYSVQCLDDFNQSTFFVHNYTFTASYVPIITLNAPENNSFETSGSVTLNCTASDNSDLINMSLYHNISGSFVLNESVTLGGGSDTENTLTTTISFVNDTDFIWNCEARDDLGNEVYSSDNYSVRVRFVSTTYADVSASSGLTNRSTGRGVCAVDYNADGLVDLALLGDTQDDLDLFNNTGEGNFTDNTVGIDAGDALAGAGCSFGDFNNDDFADLITAADLILYRNDEDDTFSCVDSEGDSACSGSALPTTSFDGKGIQFLDFNNDSFLDIWAPDTNGARIFRSNGDGTFVMSTLGSDTLDEYSAVADYDNDSYMDVFAIDDTFHVVYRNLGDGTFERKDGADLGLPNRTRSTGEDAEDFHWAFGDTDNDGDLDAFITSTGITEKNFFVNLGNGTFIDQTDSAALPSTDAGTNPAWGDIDNDGDLDLLIGGVGVYTNDGDGTFSDATTDINLQNTPDALEFVDINNDGDLDIIGQNKSGVAFSYENELNDESYLKILVKGLGNFSYANFSNRQAIGARVKVVNGSGDLVCHRQITGGEGYGQGPLAVHCGLDQTKTYEVNVTYPSGIKVGRTIRPTDESLTINGKTYDNMIEVVEQDSLPEVYLNSPQIDDIDIDGNITFNCSAIDNVDILNITLFHNISGSFVENETALKPGNDDPYADTIFNLSDLPVGLSFVWNCRAYDAAGNISFSSANHTLTIQTDTINVTVHTNRTIYAVDENISVETTTTNGKGNPIETQVVTDIIYGQTDHLWWNLSWLKRKPIYFTENAGFEAINDTVQVNITDLDSSIENCVTEIRIVRNVSQNHTIIPVSIIDGDNDTFCLVAFNASISANAQNENNYHAYYNNTDALDQNYGLIEAPNDLQLMFEDFEFGTWTIIGDANPSAQCAGGFGTNFTDCDDSGISSFDFSKTTAGVEISGTYKYVQDAAVWDADQQLWFNFNPQTACYGRPCSDIRVSGYVATGSVDDTDEFCRVWARNDTSTDYTSIYECFGDSITPVSACEFSQTGEATPSAASDYRSFNETLVALGVGLSASTNFSVHIGGETPGGSDQCFYEDISIIGIRSVNVSSSLGDEQRIRNRTHASTNSTAETHFVFRTQNESVGNHSIVSYANLSGYHSGLDSRIFEITSELFPVITIIHPTNGTTVDEDPVTLNATTADSATCKYDTNALFDYDTQGTLFSSTGGTVHGTSLGTLAEGEYTYYVKCLDTLGNVNSNTNQKSTTFIVDRTFPQIALNEPENSSNQSSEAVTFKWTASDNLDPVLSCDLTVGGSLQASAISSTSDEITSYTVAGLTNGNYTWNVSCADNINHVNISPTYEFTLEIIDIIISVQANDTAYKQDRDVPLVAPSVWNSADVESSEQQVVGESFVAGEFGGQNDISTTWSWVAFQQQFAQKPVVIHSTEYDSIDYNGAEDGAGGDPDFVCLTRIRDVNESGFFVRLDDWDDRAAFNDECPTGGDSGINLQFVAMDIGEYYLSDGTPVEVRNVSRDGDASCTHNGDWRKDATDLNYNTAFATTPYVFAGVQTNYDDDEIHVTIRGCSVNQANPDTEYDNTCAMVALNGMKEVSCTAHTVAEDVGVVIWGQDSSQTDTPDDGITTDGTTSYMWSAVRSADEVQGAENDEAPMSDYPTSYNSSFGDEITAITAMIRMDGNDGFVPVLGKDTNSDQIYMLSMEDENTNDDQAHTPEVLKILVFNDSQGFIYSNESRGFIDASSSSVDYNFTGDNFSKAAYVEVVVNVSHYNGSVSQTIGSDMPDLQVTLYDGSSFAYSYTCSLNDRYGTVGTFDHNCTQSISNESILSAWANEENRRIQVRGINLDRSNEDNDVINWTDVQANVYLPSQFTNIGPTNRSGRLVLEVQRNVSDSFSGFETIYNQSRSIAPNETIVLSDLWNPLPFSTRNHPIGLYQVHSAFFDTQGSIMQNGDGTTLNDTWQFYIDFLKITFVNPLNNSIQDQQGFDVNVSLSHINYSSGGHCQYAINNNTNVTLANITSFLFANRSNPIPLGDHNITAYCNDTQSEIVRSHTLNFSIEDLSSPEIELIHPANDSELPNGNVSFAFNVTDFTSNITNCTLTLDFVENQSIFNPPEGGNITLNVTDLTDGVHKYEISCVDNSSNNNVAISEEFQFLVGLDTQAPTVNLQTPENNTNTQNNDIIFSYTVFDQPISDNIDNCSLIINGLINHTNTSIVAGASAINNFSIQDMPLGDYNWSVNCTDSSIAHNVGFSGEFNLTISEDLDFPSIELSAPANNTVDTDGTVTFSYTPSDPSSGIANCELIINGTVDQTDTSITEDTIQTFVVGGFSDGTYSWQVNCTDDSFQVNENSSETREFSVSNLLNMTITTETDKASYEIGTQVNDSVDINVTTRDSLTNLIAVNATTDIIRGETSLSWWNYSWRYRKPIFLSNDLSEVRDNISIEVNITNLAANVSDCSTEMRVIRNLTQNHSIIEAQVIGGDDSTYCTLRFHANISANVVNENNYYAYYGNPSAVDPGYTIAERSVSVQRGSTDVGTTEIVVAINEIEVNKSFLLHTNLVDDTSPNEGMITGNITSPTELRFHHYTASGNVNISWEVVEHPDVISQHGATNIPAGQSDAVVQITEVDLSRAFIIVTGRTSDTGGGEHHDGWMRAHFINETAIFIARGTTTNDAYANWQVVEWVGATVQNGTTTLSAGVTSASASINSVDTSRSFIMFGRSTDASNGGIDDQHVRGNFSGSNFVRFEREDEDGEAIASWFVVTLPEGTTIQSDEYFYENTAEGPYVDHTINAVDLSRAFTVFSWQNQGTGTTFTNSYLLTNLTSNTNLRVAKQTVSNDNTHTYAVIEAVTTPINASSGIQQDFIVQQIDDTGLDGLVQYNQQINNFSLDTYSVVSTGDHPDYAPSANATTFEVRIDGSAPTVLLISPLDNYKSSVDNITFYFNVSDIHSQIGACELIIDGVVTKTNNSIIEEVTQSFEQIEIANGNYTWQINCSDDSSNQNEGASSERTFEIQVDTVGPQITQHIPANDGLDTNAEVSIIYSVTDNFNGVDNCSLELDGVVNTTQYNIPQVGNQTINFSNVALGVHYWNITCFDNSTIPNSNVSETWNFTVTIDVDEPVIELQSPLNDSQSISGNLTFVFNVTDPTAGIQNCSLILDGEVNQTNTSIAESINQSFEVFEIPIGTHTWSVSCIDNSEIVNSGTSEEYEFLISPDSDPPIVYLVNPPNGTQDPDANVTLQFNVSDVVSDIANCSLIINGTVNQTVFLPDEDQTTDFELENVALGDYSWSVNCTDDAAFPNTNGSLTREFIIGADTIDPEVTLVAPPTESTDSDGNITFFYQVADFGSSIDNCSLIIDEVINTTKFNVSKGEDQNFSVGGFNDGSYDWSVNCSDAAGNIGNSTSRNFSVVVDLVGPAVNLYVPANASTDSDGDLLIIYNTSDALNNISSCRLYFDDIELASNSSVQETINQSFEVTNLGDGSYEWFINCTDNSDNANIGESQRFVISIVNDIDDPLVTLLDPPDDTLENDGNRTFYYNVTDASSGISSCSLIINHAVEQTNTTVTQNISQSFFVTGLSNGENNWTVNCTDSSDNGNIGGANETRNLTVVLDEQAPIITLFSPENNTQAVSDPVNFTYMVNDTSPITNCSLYFNGTINQTNTSVPTGIFSHFIVGDFNNISVDWSVSCVDSTEDPKTGFSDNYSLVIGQDADAPVIILQNPPNDIEDTDGDVVFEYIVTDFASGIANCSLYLNDDLNVTNSSVVEGITQEFELFTMNNDNYTWQVRCTDNSTNQNIGLSEERNLTIGDDITPPVITLLAPLNESTINDDDVIFEYNVTDFGANVTNCSLFIDNQFNQTNDTIVEVASQFFLTYGQPDGEYIWHVACEDSFNNSIDSQTYTYSIFNPRPLFASIETNQSSYEAGFPALISTNTSNASADPFNVSAEVDIIFGNATDPWWNVSWKYRLPILINATNISRSDKLIEQEINFTEVLGEIGLNGTFDTNSVRVTEFINNVTVELPSQFVQNVNFAAIGNAVGIVYWVMNGSTDIGQGRQFYVYFDSIEAETKSAASYDSATFEEEGSSQSVTIDGLPSSASQVRLKKDQHAFLIDVNDGSNISNQLNVDFAGSGSLFNLTVASQRVSYENTSIVPIAVLSQDYISSVSAATFESGSVISTADLSASINSIGSSSVNMNYTTWFTSNEIYIRADLYSDFGSSETAPVRLFHNLWFAYLFQDIGAAGNGWNDYANTLQSESYNDTHNYNTVGEDLAELDAFRTTDWYSEVRSNVGGVHFFVEEMSLNGVEDTLGIISFDDAKSAYSQSDGVGFNLNSDIDVSASDEYRMRVWIVLSTNASGERGRALREDVNNPLNITPSTVQEFIGRTVNETGSLGYAAFVQETRNNASGTYSAVVRAVKNFYQDGINFTRFEIIPDTTPPAVTAISPLSFSNQINTEFVYSVSDINSIANCTLILNDAVNDTDYSITNDAQNSFTVNDINEGFYNWSVNCSDSSGNIGSTGVLNITVDYTQPNVTLHNPLDTEFLTSPDVNFNFSVLDNFDQDLSCNLTLDGVTNETDVSALNGTSTNFTVFFLPQALYTWSMTCLDDAGNSNTSVTQTFGVDLGAPTVTLNSPVPPNNWVNSENITFLFTPNDLSSIANCTLIFDDVINATNNETTVNEINNINLSLVSEGIHNWSINCTDVTDLEGNSSTEIFYVDYTFPTISLIEPYNSSEYNISSIPINFTVTDNLGDPLHCNVTIDGSVDNANSLVVDSGIIFLYNSTNFTDGTYDWNVSCIDNASNLNFSETRQFTIDTSPTVDLGDPVNHSFDNDGILTFFYTPSDGVGIDNCSFILDNVTQQTNYSLASGVEHNFTQGGIADGFHSWTVNCSDPTDNIGTASPKFFYVDTQNPQILLIDPADGNVTESTTISLNFSVIDNIGTPLSCDVYVNDAVNNSPSLDIDSGSIYEYNLSDLSDGPYVWNVSCSDNASNQNITIGRTFTIDTTPTVTLGDPINNSFDNDGNITFYFTPVDGVGLANCTLIIDDLANSTNNSVINGSQQSFIVNDINEGRHSWTVNCSDPTNNVGTAAPKIFYVDITQPVITLNAPEDGNVTASDNMTLNFTVTDNIDDLLVCNITLNDNLNATLIEVQNDSIYLQNLTDLSDGTYDWNVSCVDNSSLTNISDTYRFTVDTKPIVILGDPEENSFDNDSIVTFYYTAVDEVSIENCSLVIDGVIDQTNFSITSNVEHNFTTGSIIDGNHTWTVNCSDATNNIGTADAKVFYVDTQSPNVSFNTPAHTQIISDADVTLDFTASDNIGDPLLCNISINDTINTTQPVEVPNATNYLLNLTSLTDSAYNWSVTCYDNASHINYSGTREFTIADPPFITLGDPAPGSWTQDQNVSFEFIPVDNSGALDNCSVILNDVKNESSSSITWGITNSITVIELDDGAWLWTVNCTDGFNIEGEANTQKYINVDTTAPNITLLYPGPNNETLSDVEFNWTVTDNLANNLTCNLTIDGIVNQSDIFAVSGAIINVTVENINQSTHLWNITCWDLANNTASSNTQNFTVNVGDLIINSSLVFFNDTDPDEGEEINITAIVINNGGSLLQNITVMFWDGIPGIDGTQIGTNQTINVSANNQTNVSVIWTALLGRHEIFVDVDVDNVIAEVNETNNNASKNITVESWHVAYGSNVGDLILNDLENETIFSWYVDNATSGNVFAADYDSSVTWSNLSAIGIDISGSNTSDDFDEIDIALNSTNFPDSVNTTFSESSEPINVSIFEVFTRTIRDVPIANSTNTSNFVTGILWDQSDDTDGEYNGSEDLVFVSKIDPQTLGAYGIYDYEIRIPSELKEYKKTDVISVVFYVELR